jgi:Rrf2 family nitric oxide-sensitive transcriptional repressor
MRLTFYSDYSLRLLMYVATRNRELVTIQSAADAYGISKAHLMKAAHQLGVHGFLETVRGRGGGLRLARPADQIRLGDVVRATEEDFDMVECFDARTDSCVISGPCRLKGVLHRALKAYMAVLDEYTLADLTVKHPALVKLLQSAV